jgi:hypothetical protein
MTTMTSTNRTNNRTGTSSDPYLDDLAHLIATNGIGMYESDIARLVVRLRSHGHAGSLTELLSDHAASPIARERAFGMLVGQLARGPARRIDHLVPSAA